MCACTYYFPLVFVLHGLLHDLLFALSGTLLVARGKRPYVSWIIGALSYLVVLPQYFMLHVYH